LQEIEGFDDQVAKELKERAAASIKDRDKKLQKEMKKLGIEEELVNFEGLTFPMIVKLGKEGIKNVNNLADLASDELKEILGEIKISSKDIDEIIMKARSPWFKEETEKDEKPIEE
jgi:N utilization substance protein A